MLLRPFSVAVGIGVAALLSFISALALLLPFVDWSLAHALAPNGIGIIKFFCIIATVLAHVVGVVMTARHGLIEGWFGPHFVPTDDGKAK